VVLICISVMTNSSIHLSLIMNIFLRFSVTYPLACVQIGYARSFGFIFVVIFLLWMCECSLCFMDIGYLSGISCANVYSCFFDGPKFLILMNHNSLFFFVAYNFCIIFKNHCQKQGMKIYSYVSFKIILQFWHLGLWAI
jgi:hypothetical protein